MSSGGGAATNTGIDYQQRLAAYFLIQMLLDMDSLSGIGLEGVYSITEVSFESSSCVDDMTIKTRNGNLFIQAKRNISMSDNVDSEFQKTINQFVSQFLLNTTAHDKYILATSSVSSLKIKQYLRKILESIRLNDTDFINNPLNQAEEVVYAKLKNCVSASYKGVTTEDTKAGIVLPEYKIEIIKSDHEFDNFLFKYFKKGIKIMANPLFDMNQNPLSGIEFQPIDEIVRRKQ